jgi:hypothetical protein
MVQIDEGLTPETLVYRYLPFESLVAFVESGSAVLTNINRWDDQWEAILAKVPMVNDKGEEQQPGYSFHQDIFGQSWTLVNESDAMWRIYSPTRTGLQLKTSVGKFELIGDVERAHVGKVAYFDDVPQLLTMTERRKSPFDDALVKRAAFGHEHEVRYLTNGQFLKNKVSIHAAYVMLPLDPIAFIEGVTVDPRAPDWYLDAVIGYANRSGLRCTPTRSRLYESEPHRNLGIRRQYTPVTHRS